MSEYLPEGPPLAPSADPPGCAAMADLVVVWDESPIYCELVAEHPGAHRAVVADTVWDGRVVRVRSTRTVEVTWR